MLCIGTSGDWTKEMYDKITAPCLQSVYFNGPFRSEFSDRAIDTSNVLAIASGISGDRVFCVANFQYTITQFKFGSYSFLRHWHHTYYFANAIICG